MMMREHDTLTTDAPYLVIGGGLAATSAAETPGERASRKLRLIGNEHYLPYARPPLSKAVLSGSATPTAVLLKSEQFFRDKGIQVVLGDAASAIDTADRVVTMASGRRMPYKSALVATGLLAAPLQIPGLLAGRRPHVATSRRRTQHTRRPGTRPDGRGHRRRLHRM